jgi:GntR family transcriptional regulator/MocR family aminotransferase
MTDLMLTLDYQSNTPLYEQLCAFIIGEIQAGRLRAGERLPSKRALCEHLRISRSTAESAYGILVAEGYVEARARSGYYVQPMLTISAPQGVQKAPRIGAPSPPPARYCFSTSDVDTTVFPYTSWARINREVVQTRPQLLKLGDKRGDPELRAALCDFLHKYRGVECCADQIVMGAGVGYLLDVLLQLMDESAIVALEDPCYRGAYRAVKAGRRAHLPIPLDEQGLDVAALCASGATMAYVTPSHQFPTGITMPAGRRAQLMRWAHSAPGRYIIEDDYDSEFRHTTRPIPAMQGMDEERVIYFGTFSRTIAPSIRASYMVLPEPLLARYARQFEHSACTLSRFEQQTIRLFIERGLYARHLRRVGGLYRKRRNLLCDLFLRFPQIRFSGDDAGLHFLMTVDGLCERALIERAESVGVGVHGLSEYAVLQPVQPSTLVIGYAGLNEQDIREAAALLLRAWEIG